MYIEHVDDIIKELNDTLPNYTFNVDIWSSFVNINCRNRFMRYVEVVVFYENAIIFTPLLEKIYAKCNDRKNYEKFIMDITMKYGFKNYMYNVSTKSQFETTIVEKYNFSDFKIVFYNNSLFHILSRDNCVNYLFHEYNGIFELYDSVNTYHVEILKSYIMMMDGKENMNIEINDEIIHLTSGFKTKFLD